MPSALEGSEDLSAMADEAVADVADWVARARAQQTRAERRTSDRLHSLVDDADALAFAMAFVDRVVRPEDGVTAGRQFRAWSAQHEIPRFLGPVDKVLLWGGVRAAKVLPRVVVPLAVRRMKSLVGDLVADADPGQLGHLLSAHQAAGFRTNANLLGEAVLGTREADRRLAETTALVENPAVDYVSVKVSAVAPRLNPWDFGGSVSRLVDRLRPLYEAASSGRPVTFVNLDMEAYHDLELTVEVFTQLLSEPGLHHVDAGIVLQAYLPDSFDALRALTEWANSRRERTVDGATGGTVKVRLVKGANLAMERVEAAMRGWEQAPYGTKAEVDANYKRCLDWLLHAERVTGMTLGVASHNLFDVAFAHRLARARGVADRVDFEMLQGMAPPESRVVRDATGGMLLYTPAVRARDFDVAISYLFRRLEENASDENFLRSANRLADDRAELESEAVLFRTAVRDRWTVSSGPRRTQDRTRPPEPWSGGFRNEPDTDPTCRANREWVEQAIARPADDPRPMVTDREVVDETVARLVEGAHRWSSISLDERRALLFRVADELARRRGELLAAMVHEGRKTVAQADPEISEAIDFARYYGERATELEPAHGARFEPLGVIAVVPPWNFPVAIAAGGVLAALAAGNTVVLKPPPETPRCAELVVECAHRAGVPAEALAYLRVPDDEVGRHLITHDSVDGVILTGGLETAELFQSWKPGLRMFAETSGKNAMVISPSADLDLAVADLVDSAFGHAGQKCSAASLAICIGGAYSSERFRRQLVDAVTSLRIGPPEDLATDMGPTIVSPEGKLRRALTRLDPGESWLVEPREIEPGLWSPGVRLGVQGGSWFHQRECFGPVLGVMQARDLEEAVALQNATSFGLTGGIHSLDDAEIDSWLEGVEVGNAYVNRVTTGAIVQRQPFGGWKRSAVGPGAKAGGPNYVAQLGVWRTDESCDDEWLTAALQGDEAAWHSEFGIDRDPSGLYCEQNIFRYRPRRRVAVRVADRAAPEVAVERVVAAARRCGVPVVLSDVSEESGECFAARLVGLDVERVRVLGPPEAPVRRACNEAGIHLAAEPVTRHPREMLHFLREQSISRTLHRYGNLIGVSPVR